MPIINPTEDQFSNWMAQYYPPQQPSRRLSDLALSPQEQAALMADLQQTQDQENAAIMQQMAQRQMPAAIPSVPPEGNFIQRTGGEPIALQSIQQQGGMSLNDLLAKTGASINDKVIMSDRGVGYRTPYGSVAGLDSNGRMWEMDKPQTPKVTVKQMKEYWDMMKAQAEAQDAMGMPVGGGMTAGQASQKFLERRYGKAPEGERWKSDGSLEIIPGGKAEAKENKEKLLVEGIKKQVGTVVGKVDEALPQVSNWTAGLGSLLEKIPGTPARDLAGSVDTIKANIGFKELADMRAASPTGGALGQVAVKELEFLQAAIAALDTGQSPAVLRRNLNQVKTHYQNWAKIMDQHYKTNGGATNSPTQPAKQVVSSGTFNGRRVVKYSDGSIDYAD